MHNNLTLIGTNSAAWNPPPLSWNDSNSKDTQSHHLVSASFSSWPVLYPVPPTLLCHNSWRQNTSFSSSLRVRKAKATAFAFFLSLPYQGLKEQIHPSCSEVATPSLNQAWEGASQLVFPPGWFSYPPQFVLCFPSTPDLWSHFMNCHVSPESPVKTKPGLKKLSRKPRFLKNKN